MIDIKRILCPTDLSTESDEALRYAVALARAYEARLILLYCRKPGSIVEWANSSRAARLFEQSLFTHLDADGLKALNWEAAIAEADDIGSAIVTEATCRRADLIVMRSRRRPHAAALLGSTAETVSQMAPCPVLVTHPIEREWVGVTTPEIDLHRVLVSYDGSEQADLALHYAASMAQEHQAEIHLLHVISDEEKKGDPEVVWSVSELENSSEIVARRLHEAIPKDVFLWCNLVAVARCGRPSQEILRYAREKEIDLICMGASGADFSLDKLFGSTVDRVLRNAPCPVLVSRSMNRAAAASKAA